VPSFARECITFTQNTSASTKTAAADASLLASKRLSYVFRSVRPVSQSNGV